MELAMGMYDSPQTQEQPIFYIDYTKNNIIVYGESMSGKTTFVKTFLVRIQDKNKNLSREDVYILDFGGNIGDYSKLDCVCACFDNRNEENIKRVFKTIEKRLDDNSRMLRSDNYHSLKMTSPEKCPTHITLIIENLNAFLSDERYIAYQDTLLKLSRDGLSKGLTLLMTANETIGTGRINANCGIKVVFGMPSDSYLEIFNTKVNKPMRVPGRGVVNIDSGIYEFQTFLPFLDEKRNLKEYIDKQVLTENTNRIESFGEVLLKEEIDKYRNKNDTIEEASDGILLGLDYYEHKSVWLNIKDNRAIAIYGKRKFGKSNLLSIMLSEIRRIIEGCRIVYFDDGREELKWLYDIDDKDGKEARYIKKVPELYTYLGNTYGKLKKDNSEMEVPKNPYTVFVLQSKSLYNPTQGYVGTMMKNWIPEMVADAEAKGYMFIFSDVKRFSFLEYGTYFNNMISAAFLLDDIGEFVSDRGQKSVFGERDAKELKSEYAKCSIGDGYYYEVDADKLFKLKFIKSNNSYQYNLDTKV